MFRGGRGIEPHSKNTSALAAGLHYLMSFYSHHTGSRNFKLKCADMSHPDENNTHGFSCGVPRSVPHTDHMGDAN